MISELVREGTLTRSFDGSKQSSSLTRFVSESLAHVEFLSNRGFVNFDDYWSLPKQFVDEVNYRRGGWSGVTRLCLNEAGTSRNYYVKRQVNQFRYSWARPLGALTFEHEAAAIKYTRKLELATIDMVCWGVKKVGDMSMGLLVTPEIPYSTLEDIIATRPAWSSLEKLLYRCGTQLLEMHSHGIQQGALYPKHIFLHPLTGDTKLIDFERARRRRSVRKAITADLGQLLKRLTATNHIVAEMLLRPYQLEHGRLVADLLAAHH